MKRTNWIGKIFIGISLCMLSMSAIISWQEYRMQREISSEILRFHVLANSNSKEDQEEKMQVKNAVAAYLQPLLENTKSKEETIECIKREQYNIEEIAKKIVNPQTARTIKVSIEEDWFPAIAYGDCTFPAGMYDTLRIKIGEAKGKNWWCVLYPGLCFSSAVKPVATKEDKNILKNVLDEDCYKFLMGSGKTKIRFRLLGLEFFW